MTKFAALLINVSEPIEGQILNVVIDEDSNPIYFKDEADAIAFIKKSYSEYCIFFGLIDDPRPHYKRLRRQIFKKKGK